MKHLGFYLLAIVAVITSSARANTITGEWYSLNNKAVLTLNLLSDSTFCCTSAASSTMCFDGRYVINNDVAPSTIDFTMRSGMAAAGILRQNEDGTLDISLNFGAPGYVARPENFDEDPTSLTLMLLHCTRNRTAIEQEALGNINVPADGHIAFERNQRLGHGINIESTLDGYENGNLSADDISRELSSVAEAGFTSIRLPVRFSSHCAPEAPYLIEPDFMAKVDQIVSASIECNLPVIIDLHYYPYISFAGKDSLISYDENIERLKSLWTQIAEHYSSYPDDMVYFDLMNEPNPQLGADGWNTLAHDLITIVRKTNPGRTILVMTPSLGQHWTINYLNLPQQDGNLIVEFHYYLPHLFTHQGLEFAMANGAHDIPWLGTSEERSAIDHDLDYCAEWSLRNNRPVNIGEFGVFQNADRDSRARWLGYMHQAAHERGISTHLWSFRDGFSIRNSATGEWDNIILNAIMKR